MSFDYFLTVPSEKWPSFDQLQAALDQDGLAITIVRPDGLTGSHAFSIDGTDDCFGFLFGGSVARVEGSLTTFTEGDFQIMEDSFEPYRAHEVVEIMFQNKRPIKVGDKLCHISYWDSNMTLGVWWYVCATFVKHFGATYYDPQGDGIVDQQTLLGMAAGFCRDTETESDGNLVEALGIETAKGAPTIFERIRKFLGFQ
jgi:hypothetical protein